MVLASVATLGTVVGTKGVEQMRNVQELAEMTVVEATVRNISSGLNYAIAEDIIHGEMRRLPELAGTNPAHWLLYPPPGYIGEFASAPESVPRGAWYFDMSSRALCYRPKIDAHLTIAGGGHRLCWRIISLGDYRATEGVGSIKIVALHHYRWFGES